jgi:hypothetical protein
MESTKPMIQVYSLKYDVKRTANIERASLGSDGCGYEQTHGLFGSPEWWQQIEAGSLPIHTFSGVITRTYMGSMNDWPACEVTSDAGEVREWTREAQDATLAQLCRVGARIEIQYVIQRFRREFLPGQKMDSECVISIAIEDVA